MSVKDGESTLLLNKLTRFIDKFIKAVCVVASFASLVIVLVTFLIVVLRYGFSVGWIAMQESVMYLHALIFMLGIAYTLQVDGHVRVDVFYRRFSAQQKHWVNIIGTVLFLLPVSLFLLYFTWPYAGESWRLMETSKEPGGLPLVFVLKSLMPTCMILLILQGIAELARSTSCILTQHSEVQ